MINRQVRSAVLNFVDLAGSEKLSSHDNEMYDAGIVVGEQGSTSKVRERINEGKNINKSLFFLTQVIQMRAA